MESIRYEVVWLRTQMCRIRRSGSPQARPRHSARTQLPPGCACTSHGARARPGLAAGDFKLERRRKSWAGTPTSVFRLMPRCSGSRGVASGRPRALGGSARPTRDLGFTEESRAWTRARMQSHERELRWFAVRRNASRETAMPAARGGLPSPASSGVVTASVTPTRHHATRLRSRTDAPWRWLSRSTRSGSRPTGGFPKEPRPPRPSRRTGKRVRKPRARVKRRAS